MYLYRRFSRVKNKNKITTERIDIMPNEKTLTPEEKLERGYNKIIDIVNDPNNILGNDDSLEDYVKSMSKEEIIDIVFDLLNDFDKQEHTADERKYYATMVFDLLQDFRQQEKESEATIES